MLLLFEWFELDWECTGEADLLLFLERIEVEWDIKLFFERIELERDSAMDSKTDLLWSDSES